MTLPTFTRGLTPYWTYPCGCQASALALTYCARHAATGDLITLLAEVQRYCPVHVQDRIRAALAAAKS